MPAISDHVDFLRFSNPSARRGPTQAAYKRCPCDEEVPPIAAAGWCAQNGPLSASRLRVDGQAGPTYACSRAQHVLLAASCVVGVGGELRSGAAPSSVDISDLQLLNAAFR
jgi:hypothetical protein